MNEAQICLIPKLRLLTMCIMQWFIVFKHFPIYCGDSELKIESIIVFHPIKYSLVGYFLFPQCIHYEPKANWRESGE